MTLLFLLQQFENFTEVAPSDYPIFQWGGLVIGQEGLVFGQQEEEVEDYLILEVKAFINSS